MNFIYMRVQMKPVRDAIREYSRAVNNELCSRKGTLQQLGTVLPSQIPAFQVHRMSKRGRKTVI
jgi:hypothetical protein